MASSTSADDLAGDGGRDDDDAPGFSRSPVMVTPHMLEQGLTLSIPALSDSVHAKQGVTARSNDRTFEFFLGFSRR